ncbi:uncharacterized protein LOC127804437 [Diospyros lotus]|uniref:uncharacterized protein LOC127804437 n=1 Tax=Diospyros lotus TaxID=55363 RepID=UPI00224FDEE9|nr:uncharacterized protein LOC127804437 [Diospyros lotus]
MEAYVDDMVVKSLVAECHSEDLEECFKTLRKFLGYIVHHRGIEVNPAKVKAIMDMPAPRSVKEVQSLTGRMTALGRFLSRLAEKGLPFYKILSKANNFEWNSKCQRAFEKLKEHLATPPVLTKPKPGEPLYTYLAVANEAVSSVLIREEDKIQRHVYYASKRLTRAEVLSKPELSRQMLKWAVELTAFDIEYKPQPAIKAQSLADFITKGIGTPEGVEENQGPWLVAVDRSLTSGGGGARLMIKSPEGKIWPYALHFEFRVSNNEAEYEALLAGLRLAEQLGAQNVEVSSDSNLVVQQVNGEYEARESHMARYLAMVKELMAHFQHVKVEYVPRAMNTEADLLSRIASSSFPTSSREIRIESLPQKSIEEVANQLCVEDEPSWMDPLLSYLREERLPEDDSEAWEVNGQIELANRTLLRGLKARVDKAKGSWVEELSSILWSYRTTVKLSTRETPFSLCYGSEALIPVEIGVPTLRVELFNPESNEQSLRDNLNLLDEFRDQVKIRQAAYN